MAFGPPQFYADELARLAEATPTTNQEDECEDIRCIREMKAQFWQFWNEQTRPAFLPQYTILVEEYEGHCVIPQGLGEVVRRVQQDLDKTGLPRPRACLAIGEPHFNTSGTLRRNMPSNLWMFFGDRRLFTLRQWIRLASRGDESVKLPEITLNNWRFVAAQWTVLEKAAEARRGLPILKARGPGFLQLEG